MATSQFLLDLILYTSIGSLIIFMSLIKRKKNSPQTKRLPPGPPKLPLIGNLHQLKPPLHRALHQLSNKHGDIMFLKLGQVPALVISSAEIMREITKDHDLTFSGRAALHVPNKLTYNSLDIVFSPYGEHWRELKKVMVTELLSMKRVQSFQAVRGEEVTLLLDSIAQSSGPIDLSNLLVVTANNIVCRAAFGKKVVGGSDGSKDVRNILRVTQDLIGSGFVSDFFPSIRWINKFNGFDAKLEKTYRELEEFYNEVIQEHLDPKKPKAEHEDLADVLLRLRKDSTQSVPLSNNVIKALFADIFIAGSDTTSSTLVWTMTELMRNPTVMKRAQEEVRTIVQGKGKVEENDLSQLVYLKSVVKETLRLHPPSPLLVPRETIEACQIRGYEIPTKTMVFVNVSAISLDPRSWENPYEFRPERFLDNSKDFRGRHYELIPFGAGRRSCPGMNFAVLIIELVLANLLHRFDWELPYGLTGEDLDVTEISGLTALKKNPLCLIASPTNL